MRPTFYRGCWHVVSRHFFRAYRPFSSALKALYDPKAFLGHAALLRQAFAHCAISLTAASRRSRARLSVPVWGTTLSGPLPVFGLVGRDPTNYLMGRRPLPERIAPFPHETSDSREQNGVLAALSSCCPPLRGRSPTCYSPGRHLSLTKQAWLGARSTCIGQARRQRSS